MKYIAYFWLSSMARIRGHIGIRSCSKYETCTTGLNGRGEAVEMYINHGWIPYIYRKVKGASGLSRTFITSKDD